MAIRLAINGFGRIGRLVLRAILEGDRSDVEVVGINDLGPVETNAHLLRYDTVHGPLNKQVTTKDGGIDAGRGSMKVTAERDPAKLPWKELSVDIALECTGLFTKRDDAAKHLQAGAKPVLISAPGPNADLTVVYGVNHQKLEKSHTIVSNASCTTNCLAPVAAVMHKAIGIEQGYIDETPIHSYTGDQPVLDTLHKDLYRARAAALSDDPDHDRCGEGRRRSAARAEGQAGRFIDPRADAKRVDDRFQLRAEARHDGRRGEQNRNRSGDRQQQPAERHPGGER